MRAITYNTYGDADVLTLAHVPTPEPGPGEVRIRVHAATVSSADVTFRRGKDLMARLFTGLRAPKRPVLGTELAGTIDAIGEGVTRHAVGDVVFGATGDSFGAHADHVVVAEDAAIAPAPRDVDAAGAAALAEGMLTALPFLRDVARLQPGQRILIIGAVGSVGAAAVQLARHMGAHVTAVVSGRNLALARQLGADAVIDYTTTDFTAGEARFDVVFDAVGKSSFRRARRILERGGLYMTTVLGAGILFQSLWTRLPFVRRRARIALTGLRKPSEKVADLALIRAWAEDGVIVPVIDSRFYLADAADAHRLVESGRKRGHAVLELVPAA